MGSTGSKPASFSVVCWVDSGMHPDSRAAFVQVVDDFAQFKLYVEGEYARSFTWPVDELDDRAEPGDQFRVSFNDGGTLVTGVQYDEELTRERKAEMREQTVRQMRLMGVSEAAIERFLRESGASDEVVQSFVGDTVQQEEAASVR